MGRSGVAASRGHCLREERPPFSAFPSLTALQLLAPRNWGGAFFSINVPATKETHLKFIQQRRQHLSATLAGPRGQTPTLPASGDCTGVSPLSARLRQQAGAAGGVEEAHFLSRSGR